MVAIVIAIAIAEYPEVPPPPPVSPPPNGSPHDGGAPAQQVQRGRGLSDALRCDDPRAIVNMSSAIHPSLVMQERVSYRRYLILAGAGDDMLLLARYDSHKGHDERLGPVG